MYTGITAKISTRSTYRKILLGFFALCIMGLSAAVPQARADDYKNPFNEKKRELYAPLDLTKKQYYACKDASQCAVVNMPCGAKVVISKAYQQDLQGWYDFVGPRYKCAVWLKPQEANNITCTNNLCRADITVAKPVVDHSPAARDPLYCDTANDCQPVTKSCGEKIVVNKKYGDLLQKQYNDLKNVSHCFHIDGRTVKNVTCQKHQCAVELEIPLELPDKLHPDNPLEVKPVTVPNPQIPQPPGLVSPQSRMTAP